MPARAAFGGAARPPGQAPGLPAILPGGVAEAHGSRGAWGMEAGGAGGVGKNERSRSDAAGALEA
jgi:hypothetical protein